MANRSTFFRRTAAALGASMLLVGGAAPAASASPSLDVIEQANVYDTVRNIVNQPGVPEDVRNGINRALDFLTGEGDSEPGFEVPENAPRTNQFLIPTVADKCIRGESRSFGLATAVPGPAPLPLPGVPADQLGFVFTGLGTSGVAPQQNTSVKVHWVNAANAKFGTTELGYTGVNPEGPGTVNGVANTGKGVVVAFLEGGFTANEETGPADCNYTPTAGVFPVGLGI